MKKSKIIRNTFYAQLGAFILSSLSSSIGSMVDGVIIGRYLGVDSMAAFGIINPMMIVFALAGAIVSSGARAVFTRFIGGGELKKAKGVFALSVILSVGIATIFMLVILAFSTPFTRLLGASGNAAFLLEKARGYLIGIAFGLPAMNAMRILSSYMSIDNDRHLPILASITLAVTDVIADLLVVFVLHGDTFEMGAATSISYYVAVAVLLTHFRKKSDILGFSLRNIAWRETKGILSKGIPIGVCRAGNTLRSLFMNHLLAVIASSAAIAAYSVHRQADSFFNPVTIGMADTVAMLSGVLIGEEDRPMLKKLLLTSVQATFLITLAISLLLWGFAPQFASLFVRDDPEALMLSVRATRAYALGMPFYGLNLIYGNYQQGIGKNRLSSVSLFLSECAFLILSASLMADRFGADAVWFAFSATQVLMFLFYAIVIATESRRLQIHREGLSNRMLLLPDSFDVTDENRLDDSITTLAEVDGLSRAVWEFCERHGSDKRHRYFISLAVEEMANNVIQHGFSKDNKPHHIDMRILKKDDDYIIRIRDDCIIFDPVNQIMLFSDDAPGHHMGLRMLTKMSTDMRYTCILKLNNLLVRI